MTNVDDLAESLRMAISDAIDHVATPRAYITPNINVRLQPDTRATIKSRNEAKRRGDIHYKHLRNKACKLVRRDTLSHTTSQGSVEVVK
ncbi:Hypothetical protein FKW44_008458 [Caligus rogercresseyi]|uniref:Uncharacterized protein n=1 Tax=Caligus rogercresseyi TaxID=217165 RepID=A0A7T8KG49_CALRO|nr:Hypothetical protein FKW44_008458 [Caligus rogercresseyi]